MLFRLFIVLVCVLACSEVRCQIAVEKLETPNLRFGMEIRRNNLGIEVADISIDRPISKKLLKGDILRSYAIIDSQGTTQRINTPSDIDTIKLLLADGKNILLNILRPAEGSGYLQITLEVLPTDLLAGVTVSAAPLVEHTSTKARVLGPSGEVLVGVYYATDRARENSKYTGNRDAGALKYGVCSVSLPPDHIQGRLERPQFWSWLSRESPAKHVMVRSIAQIGREEVFSAIGSAFSLVNSPRKRALVFIHGFNVSFEEAAMRSAQLHYDLDFPGVTMFYSWPSDGLPHEYVSDMADVDWSIAHLVEFLRDLESRDVDDVYLLAHSMGNRALLQALLRLQAEGKGKKFKEVMLTAADVDAQLFTEQIAPVITNYYSSTTVYASSSDKALWGSEALSSIPRVGEVRHGSPTVAEKDRMHVIDVSQVSSDFVGHSYFGDNTSVVTDLKALIDNGNILPRNPLKRVSGTLGRYWEFEPTVAP